MKKILCTSVLSLGILASTLTPGFASDVKNQAKPIRFNDAKNDSDFKFGMLTEKSKEKPDKIVENYYSKKSGKSKKDFKKNKQYKNSTGKTVINTQQTYNGISVYGTEQNYHVNEDGVIVCVIGSNVEDISAKLASSKVPAPKSTDAILAAVEKDLGYKPEYYNKPKEEMILFPVDGLYQYVYKVTVEYRTPSVGSFTYYLDASSLSVVKKVSNLLNVEEPAVGSGIGQFNNVKYYLKMVKDNNIYYLKNTVDNIVTRNYGNGNVFSEPDSFFNSGSYLQKNAVDAHSNLQKVVNFFRGFVFNRNGQDDLGSQITIDINDNQYAFNAYAFLNNIFIEVGQGPAGKSVACGLDAIAHEYTHGILLSEGLSAESTALHEGIADVFATICEYYLQSEGSFDWYIGEDTGRIFRNCAFPIMNDMEDVRRYSNPSTKPHTKGGVITKAAYLIAEGGYHNDYYVAGIGYYKLANIFYHAINDGYIVSDMSFQQFASALLDSANSLYGPTSNEINAVRNALYSVGLGLENAWETDRDITLRWPGRTGAIYGIYYKLRDYSSSEPTRVFMTSMNEFTISKPSGKIDYYIAEVNNTNGNRISPFSNPVTTETYKYTSPQNLWITGRSGLSLNLAWMRETGVKYAVYSRKTGSKFDSKIAETTNGSVSVTTSQGSNEFFVTKVDSAGCRISPESNSVTVDAYGSSPANFTMTSTNYSQVNLSWQDEQGVRYGIFTKRTGTNDEPVKLTETLSSYASVHTLLGTYDFYVAKVDGSGYRISQFSSPVTKTLYTNPPVNVQISSRYQNFVALEWDCVTSGKYEIYSKPTGSSGTPVKFTEASSRYINFTLFSGSNDYYIMQIDDNGYRISDFSTPITIVSQ